jgi:hypothetical protein
MERSVPGGKPGRIASCIAARRGAMNRSQYRCINPKWSAEAPMIRRSSNTACEDDIMCAYARTVSSTGATAIRSGSSSGRPRGRSMTLSSRASFVANRR